MYGTDKMAGDSRGPPPNVGGGGRLPAVGSRAFDLVGHVKMGRTPHEMQPYSCTVRGHFTHTSNGRSGGLHVVTSYCPPGPKTESGA